RKPVRGAQVVFCPVSFTYDLFCGCHVGEPYPRAEITDGRGEAVKKDLPPEDCWIYAGGQRKRVKVEEGRQTGPVIFYGRAGALAGRVLDAGGRPLAEADVIADFPSAYVHDRPFLLPSYYDGVLLGGSRADGSFRVEDFPWNCPSVTLRVERG